MGLVRQLDSIDRRIVARGDRRFDVPKPWWVRYSFVVSLPLLVSIAFARGYGGGWWVAVWLSALIWLITLVAVSRWTGAHRRPKEKPDIAADGQQL